MFYFVAIGAAPFTVSLVILCICLSITSVAMGFLDTGEYSLSTCIWLLKWMHVLYMHTTLLMYLNSGKLLIFL